MQQIGRKISSRNSSNIDYCKEFEFSMVYECFFQKKVQVNWLSGAFRHVKLDCLFYKIFILLTYNDKLATTVFCASINNLYLKALVMVN